MDDDRSTVSPRRHRLPLLVTALAGVALLLSGIGLASFNAGNSSGFSVASDRIFPGARTTAAWSVVDAGDGSAADVTFPAAVGEGSYLTTGNWSSSFSGTRYLDFALSAPLPGGLATSSVSFSFDFADDVAGQTACFYIEVYRASDSSLLGTHGSSGSPLACVTGTTLTHTATTLTEVTSSDTVNDLRVRVYAKESGGTALRVDLATVTGSAYAAFTAYPAAVGDRSTGTLSKTTWGLAASGDGAVLTTDNAWATTFAAGRSVTFTFPAEAPTSAAVTAASFTLSYRAGTNGSNSCWYAEVYDGSSALIGTHGSSGSPISCNSSGSAWQTDEVTLSEVDTGPELNSLQVKIYFKTSGPAAVVFDLARLSETYSLGSA